jgi:hypothetical protein
VDTVVQPDSFTTDVLATGKVLFRQREPLSFVDTCIVAYMQTGGLGYLYVFDDEFDGAEEHSSESTTSSARNPRSWSNTRMRHARRDPQFRSHTGVVAESD